MEVGPVRDPRSSVVERVREFALHVDFLRSLARSGESLTRADIERLCAGGGVEGRLRAIARSMFSFSAFTAGLYGGQDSEFWWAMREFAICEMLFRSLSLVWFYRVSPRYRRASHAVLLYAQRTLERAVELERLLSRDSKIRVP